MVFTMKMNRDILFGSAVDSSFSKGLIRNKDDRNIMFLAGQAGGRWHDGDRCSKSLTQTIEYTSFVMQILR